jgi:hypothetical protein
MADVVDVLVLAADLEPAEAGGVEDLPLAVVAPNAGRSRGKGLVRRAIEDRPGTFTPNRLQSRSPRAALRIAEMAVLVLKPHPRFTVAGNVTLCGLRWPLGGSRLVVARAV